MKNWQAKAFRLYLWQNPDVENSFVRWLFRIFFLIGLVFPWAYLYPNMFTGIPILTLVEFWPIWIVFSLPFILGLGIPLLFILILNAKALS